MPYRYLRRTGNAQYHYVYNVGAGNKTIFRSSHDFERFIKKIKEYIRNENRINVIAYCLTGNSYHLIVEELQVGATAQLIHRLSVAYAMYFNARYKELGHLFRGPYKEEQIENADALVAAVSKLHAMPRAAKLKPETYRWSSFQDYLQDQVSWLHKAPILEYFQGSDIPTELQRYTDTVELDES